VKDVLVDATHFGEAVVGECPCTVLMCRCARQCLQDFFRTAGNEPAPRLCLQGKAEAFQALCPVDQEVPVLPDEVALSFSRSEVENALVSPLGDQYPVEPGQPLGVHLAGEFAGEFELALMPSSRVTSSLARSRIPWAI
jgi:hypothetical protein